MIKSFLFAALVAIALAQTATVNNLSQTQSVVTLTPGVNYTTGFFDQVGSQFRIWVPSNASTINISWQRSASDGGDTCSSSAYAYLYGKWGTWPCSSSAYNGLTGFCTDYESYSYSASSALTVTLDAYDSEDTPYWYSGSRNDFYTGQYLYLASYLDLDYNCSATINVTFEYCPANTIPVEGSSAVACSVYTNVTGNTYSETVTSATAVTKFYLVHVPQNASGVRATVVRSTSGNTAYLYGRISTGGYDSNYYYDYDYSSSNFSQFWPNIPAGDFVVTLESTSGIDVALSIAVEICPNGIASDEDGNCTYPLVPVTSANFTSGLSVTVPPSDNVNQYCNWKVYQLDIPANTYSFYNVTINIPTTTSTMYVYLRKNAWPLTNIYDDYTYSSTVVWNFTPEDLYVNHTSSYYFGFCNPSSTETVTFTASATVKVAPSPSPSSSPSFVPASATPSASGSPDPDNSGTSAVVSVVVMLLAAVVVMF